MLRRLVLLACLLLTGSSARTVSESASETPVAPPVRAAERGGPWLSLRDGFDVEARYYGEADLVRLMHEGLASPLALASADLDADAMADVVAAYATPQGGLLAVQRGHRAFLYPQTNEELRAERAGTALPFEGEAHLLALPVQPEVVLAGHFDADRHVDLVAASLRGHAFYLLAGDGAGGFSEPVRVRLPGRVTALGAGEVNRRDGLTDLVAGVAEAKGPRLYVFEGPHGILSRAPEAFDLKDEARSVATAWLDEDVWRDVAVAAGEAVEVIRGRDRRLTLSAEVQAEVPPAARVRHGLGFAATALATGDFVGEYGDEVAVVGPAGELVVFDGRGGQAYEARVAVRADALVKGRPSADPGDDLIMIDRAGGALHVLQREHFEQMAAAVPAGAEVQALPAPALVPVTLGVEGVPVGVAPARLNKDAMSDLVVLRSGKDGSAGGLSVVLTAPRAVFNVNLDVARADYSKGDGVCDVDEEAEGEQCTLRAATEEVNYGEGAFEIRFDIETLEYTNSGEGGLFKNPVTIDGTLGRAGEEVRRVHFAYWRGLYSWNIVLQGGQSTILNVHLARGRILMGRATDEQDPIAAGGSRLEGLLLGGPPGAVQVDITSPGNIIGGPREEDECRAPCNLMQYAAVETTLGHPTDGTRIEGNYLDLDPTGTVSTSRDNFLPVNLRGANSVVVGNAGNATYQISGDGALVQENLIGMDITGTFALQNALGNGGIHLSANHASVGGAAGRGNLIGGRGTIAVVLDGDGQVFQGNHIGVDRSGTRAIPNATNSSPANILPAVSIVGRNVAIGGAISGSGNIIAGNVGSGVRVWNTAGDALESIVIQGNYVGVGCSGGLFSSTPCTGTMPLGNGSHGIHVASYDGTARDIRIGGTDIGAANHIAHNGGDGVRVEGAHAVTVRANHIHDNGGLGLNLHVQDEEQSVTENDYGPESEVGPPAPHDVDDGANGLQNYPELSLVPASADGAGDEYKVKAVLRSEPNTRFTVDLYKNAQAGCDASGHGEGEELAAYYTEARTNAEGYTEFMTGFTVREDDYVTATATDPDGNTSEFSHCAVDRRIVVNDDGDDEDADLTDGVCDVDPGRDGRQCTLRAAIQTANARAGDEDEIVFDLGEGIPTIAPESPLPPITEGVTIDGHTGDADRVDVAGEDAGEAAAGLHVAGPDVVVRGLGLRGFDLAGILVEGATNAWIGGPGEGQGNTLWENGSGLFITGSQTSLVVAQGNCIGAEDCDEPPEANEQVGVRIADGVVAVTLGGETPEEGNTIYGGVYVTGAATHGVTLRNNTLGILGAGLPFDVGDDGPSCFPWDDDGTGPSHAMPTPRVLSLTASSVSGYTRPGAVVEVYRVQEMGTFAWRHFPRQVEPLGHATADADGAFTVPVSLEADDVITVTATDTGYNTSELAQVGRPVIFVPGVGGSNLIANGRHLWLPGGATDATQNQNLFDMRMDEQGNSVLPVTAPTVLEVAVLNNIPDQRVIYAEVLDFLEAHGYDGDLHNDPPSALDLFRYPYDWRTSITESAAGLQALVDRLTLPGSETAGSCKVDIVAHSMGNLVTSLYLRTGSAHSRSRVNRYISVAAPLLGAPMAVAAHTKGYIFELETQTLYGTNPVTGSQWFDVDWSRMLAMLRNLPAVYALAPSEGYWKAGGRAYLQDLVGRELSSYEETFRFVTAGKADPQGASLGLGRNAQLWRKEQSLVHAFIDDWTGWVGPPQVFRLVGNLPRSTVVAWDLNTHPLFLYGKHREEEPDDQPAHIQYRGGQMPIPGRGDGTVALVSARLGKGFPGADLSGTSSPWIEDFEEFACGHFPIMTLGCEGGRSLNRMLDILRYRETAGPDVSPRATVTQAEPQELVYVFTAPRAAVYVEDEAGNRTGPVHPDALNKIAYGVPGIGYWPNDAVVAVSLEPGRTYALDVVAPREETRVQVVRLIAGDETSAENLLYDPQTLQPGGSLRWTAGGPAPTTAVELDADGNGAFEAGLEPEARFESTEPAPALPSPVPAFIDRRLLTGSVVDQEVTLTLPGVGGPAWTWGATESADWISLSAVSGTTPDSFRVTLAATALGEGRHRDTVYVTLRQQDYEALYVVPVQLDITGARVLSAIDVTPTEAFLRPGETLQFEAQGRDQVGDPFPLVAAWTATGGTIDAEGLFTAGDVAGTFAVTATDAATGIEGTATVEVVSGVGVDEGAVPEAFRLHANYPNPFNPQTVIRYDVPETAEVHLTVYDALGRQVEVLVDAVRAPGRYEAVFDAARLPSGVYVYRIEMGPYRAAGRMVVVK